MPHDSELICHNDESMLTESTPVGTIITEPTLMLLPLFDDRVPVAVAPLPTALLVKLETLNPLAARVPVYAKIRYQLPFTSAP